MTPDRLQRIQQTLRRRQPDLTVVTDEVHKGRNISAILRTCDAVGIGTVHVVDPSAGYRPYRGTALGAQKWVEVKTYRQLADPVTALKEQGFQLVATSCGPESVDFTAIDYCRPTALLLGAERSGVSAAGLAAACIRATIPMVGMVESFNVSVASAVILLEAQRQRRVAGLYDRCRVSHTEYRRRLLQWAHPRIASFCDARGLPYPDLREDGELVDPSGWYAEVRAAQAPGVDLPGAPEMG